ncbi:MAG: aspartate carbamoyltransferase, partial [bacterium]|nr:aspartate carbamoyltransferase [bacterium]
MITGLKTRHLLGLEYVSKEEIELILQTAKPFKELFTRSVKKVPTLRGKTLVNLFYEASTRTRTSFELAAKRLSADVINIAVASSSVTKGESLIDTVRTIEAMKTDFL